MSDLCFPGRGKGPPFRQSLPGLALAPDPHPVLGQQGGGHPVPLPQAAGKAAVIDLAKAAAGAAFL